MISTKGRYALRVLVDLAGRKSEDFVPLRDVAQSQDISEKYLQRIARQLVDAGILEGIRGKGGGYRLAKPADKIYVCDVLEAAEGTLAPVSCLVDGAPVCERTATCKTLPLWKQFYDNARELFGSVSVEDLKDGSVDCV